MGNVIAITNQKGGIGKTSTTVSIANGLYHRGYRTLVIDSDPQCNSTDTYRAEIENQATLYDLFHGNSDVQEVIQQTKSGPIIACDPLLRKADNDFLESGREFILSEGLQTIRSKYDFIIIDTTPALGILLANAITAADYLIIPTMADRYSLQGLDQLKISIEKAKKYTNTNLKILGILMTMYQKQTNLSKDTIEILPVIEDHLQAKFFNTKVRLTVSIKDAARNRMPVFDYDKKCTGAKDYNNLIDEILERIKEK